MLCVCLVFVDFWGLWFVGVGLFVVVVFFLWLEGVVVVFIVLF